MKKVWGVVFETVTPAQVVVELVEQSHRPTQALPFLTPTSVGVY